MSSGKAWYAIEVAVRKELFVSSTLSQKGFEAWAPSLLVPGKRNSGPAITHQAAFPGYLFGRFDARYRLPVLTTSGVRRIVGYLREPVPIPDAEIESLKHVFSSDRVAHRCEYLSAGQRVRIKSGPLAGVEGILLELKGQYQVVVSVHLLQRSVRVQLGDDAVEPVRSLEYTVPVTNFWGMHG